MLTSLDELALRCVNKTSQSQILETIKTHNSGAYRAAIISTYVTVCFDLIAKMKDLANLEDRKAGEKVNEFRNMQESYAQNNPDALRNFSKFEGNLLEIFKDDFELFGQNEFVEMDRLRSDRHRCAHPSFCNNDLPFEPSAELSRLHIFNALKLVLTVPEKQGKSALKNLREIVLGKYFPDIIPEAKVRLSGSALENARPILIESFIDELCYGYINTEDEYFLKKPVITTLKVLMESHTDQTKNKLIKVINKILELNDEAPVKYGFQLALHLNLADGLEKSNQTIMQEILKEKLLGQIVKQEVLKEEISLLNRLRIAGMALEVKCLEEISLGALGKFKSADYSAIYHGMHHKLITGAAKLYASSRNWIEANSNAESFAINYAPFFSKEDIEIIFNNTSNGENDLHGSHTLSEFVDALKTNNLERINMVDGLIEDYKIRVNSDS